MPNKLFRLFAFVGLSVLLFPLDVKAQIDPQFSQYYAAPLFLNPAFAGATQYTRFGANYRNQWPSIDANFVTYAAYGDHFFEDYNSGVGLMILTDKEGFMGFRSSQIALQYSYQLEITDNITFRPGFEGSLFFRDINFQRLTFPNQFNEGGFTGAPSGEDLGEGMTRVFGDISTGGLFYSNNLWAGFAVHHLLTPNTSMFGETSRMDRKFGFHAGYRILLSTGSGKKGFSEDGRERSVTPTLNFRKQGVFDQLDLGTYLTFEPIMFGLWYRGIPYKPYNEMGNNESLVMMVGFSMDNLRIGYSFDYTISRLGIGAGGAHELSVAYVMNLRNPKKPPKNVRRIPCPSM
jgi:type IX secretion system PorP/SprF family membrane protein